MADQRGSSSKESTVNPFTHKLHFTYWDILKIAFNTLWLLPLRMIILMLSCIAFLSIGFIAGTKSNKPLYGWRKVLFHRGGSYTMRMFLLAFGFHSIKVKGKRASFQEAPIKIVAPHSSVCDYTPLCIGCVPSFISKMENKKLPFFGYCFNYGCKCIFVDRTDPNCAEKLHEDIMSRINSKDEWPDILIYPEGTTTNSKSMIRFKLGAFKPQVPVQPISIRFPNRLNTMVWADDSFGVVASFYLTFCQFYNNLEVEFMPVYYPSEEEKKDPKLFAENVRSLMAQSCDIPTSEHTFEDILLGRKAKSLGMPYASGIVEYGRTIKPFQVSFDQIKKLLLQFAQIDCNKDGLISAEDLAQYLKIPYDSCCSVLFDKLDKDKEGLITFKSYVDGLLTLSQPLLNDEPLLQQMFNFFDEDSDGLMTREDLFKLPFIKREGNEENEDLTNHLHFRHQHKDSTTQSGHKKKKEEKEERVVSLLDMTGPWNYDQFKSLIEDNVVYLLLYHECQNAGLSAVSST